MVSLFLAAFILSSVYAQNDYPSNSSVSTETIAPDINIPWGIEFLPNGDMLVTERGGTLYRVRDGQTSVIGGAPEVVAEGQGGLLDVTLHPDYKNNGWIYFSYSKGGRTDSNGKALATTAIVRARLQGDQLTDMQEVFVAEPWSTTRHHYGSRIVFDRDGYMYFSVGDRGNRDRNPQRLDNHCGKIHRVNDDGSTPSDNPFVNSPIAMSTIYSYGHRNPQGLVINPLDGTLWEHEHGPQGGDEVNIIDGKKNYGWPVISYGINYDGTRFTDITTKEGMENPQLYWVPSIAPSGMEFISSDKYGDWKDDLLVGSLRFQYLHHCEVENGKIVRQEKLLEEIGRVRSIKQGPDGFIYIGVEGKGVLKLIRN